MPMSEDQFSIAVEALRRIAADHEKTNRGDRKRLQRSQAINIARETCERLGIKYGAKSIPH
jgi:hypothetical protein